MENISDWVIRRLSEPSSYAAAAAGGVGVGVLIEQPVIVMVGVAAGILGLILKEKGMI
mgnify:CR=1 FL=1